MAESYFSTEKKNLWGTKIKFKITNQFKDTFLLNKYKTTCYGFNGHSKIPVLGT